MLATMTTSIGYLALDLAVILVLVYAVYYPRHRRRDLPVAYLALNLGVFAVVLLLAAQRIELAVGFGLFGILSIIRLRSDQISQTEVAYYFTSLVLGLVNGLHPDPLSTLLLDLLLLGALFVADHPRILARGRRRIMTLDVAYAREQDALPDLHRRLGRVITRVDILEVNYVQDTTLVEVGYQEHR